MPNNDVNAQHHLRPASSARGCWLRGVPHRERGFTQAGWCSEGAPEAHGYSSPMRPSKDSSNSGTDRVLASHFCCGRGFNI